MEGQWPQINERRHIKQRQRNIKQWVLGQNKIWKERRKKGQRRSRMGGDAKEKKKKGRQGVQDLNLECSILFKGVEYISI